jgi:hypothetical protein
MSWKVKIVSEMRSNEAMQREVEQLTNSVALVRERTIPTERLPLVGEVIASFCD